MPTFFEWYDIFIINVKFVLKRENPLREKLVKMSTVFFELIIISTKENLKGFFWSYTDLVAIRYMVALWKERIYLVCVSCKKTVFMLNNTSFLDTNDTNLLTTILYQENLILKIWILFENEIRNKSKFKIDQFYFNLKYIHK